MSLPTIFFGALLSALAALVLLLLVRRERRAGVVATAAGAALLMPMLWNSILDWTGAIGLFSHDLPFPPFPVSWQDTGTGVFTLAGTALALMVGPCRNDRARNVSATTAVTALAALLVDVYLY
ncbi:hypothetical protein QFZ35_001681 [Arthrobacter ulcerisalmonis]|nr:hypothetical protein [Arthrobacter ulcerisalmonis]MDQ0663183.1 hypothetical protein [Arthrobacter ulcerisalmonis]